MKKKSISGTVGCQMNVLDSEMVIADLKRHGYVVVDTPQEADCVFCTTLAVFVNTLKRRSIVRSGRFDKTKKIIQRKRSG